MPTKLAYGTTPGDRITAKLPHAVSGASIKAVPITHDDKYGFFARGWKGNITAW